MAKAGRKTKYKKEYVEQAKKLCALGAIDVQLADFFNVCEDTINEWKKVYPEFSESLKKGKSKYDNETVVNSLLHRAIGYQHKEDKIFMHNGKPVIVETIKHYPPDPTSCIFWLKNRLPDEWREKVEGKGDDEDPPPVEIIFQVLEPKDKITITNAKT